MGHTQANTSTVDHTKGQANIIGAHISTMGGLMEILNNKDLRHTRNVLDEQTKGISNDQSLHYIFNLLMEFIFMIK